MTFFVRVETHKAVRTHVVEVRLPATASALSVEQRAMVRKPKALKAVAR